MDVSFHRHSPSASDRALKWFLRLREPACTDAERVAFEQWLAADGTHRGEYEAITDVWTGLEPVAESPSHELQGQLSQAMKPRGRSPQTARSGSPWRAVGYWTAIAATIVLTSATAWWWIEGKPIVTAYHTAKGEQRSVVLDDGTVMDLNTGTDVTVRMWKRGRQVVVESGEVYFTVAQDPARPFEVLASEGHIHDIGTQFAVYKQPDRVVVSVESGAVNVELPSEGKAISAGHVLNAGERGAYVTHGGWAPLDTVMPKYVAAWRHGTLRFDGVPLSEALSEVERYWPGRVLLVDAALGTTQIRGVFNTRNLAEFFTALPNIVPVEIANRSGDIIISRR
ncbi:FecR domain-containing protein [Nitrospira sp. KM1]|uniref:FecR family protein n=1 Tax=Nitrospira sp. KM1 TaxID=1936990 RepID=UPI001564F4B3|nr:FecR domain-containing protein [Nitrospira sp. KM1]